MSDEGEKSTISSKAEDVVIWQHRAQFLAGDYRVDPKDHARDADTCPLCQKAKVN